MQRARYQCLILDHDDTVVRTTPDIHYPSFVETLALLRPKLPIPTLEEYIRDNCTLGFAGLCDKIGFTREEIELEGQMWRRWTEKTVPQAYEGMKEMLHAFRMAGGRICVCSHSEEALIRRDYRARFDMEPDMVFGWEIPRHLRKPHPHALDVIMETWNLAAEQLLVVDDMRLGLDMAHQRRVDFAWAAWSETAPVVRNAMESDAEYIFRTPKELQDYLRKE